MFLEFLYRASFQTLATTSKRKTPTEGEDTEEDVEEQKVHTHTHTHTHTQRLRLNPADKMVTGSMCVSV